MIKTHEREKLIETTLYFAIHTHCCGKIKLIKLLYLLDFAHFRETGRSVTGLEYRAWKLGPVPPALFAEWEHLDADFAAAVAIEPEKVYDYSREKVVPLRDFDDSHFSRRELRLMRELATKYRDELSKPLVNFTHQERGPWEKIWEGGRGDQKRIPYLLAIADTDPARDIVLDAAEQYDGIVAAVGRAH